MAKSAHAAVPGVIGVGGAPACPCRGPSCRYRARQPPGRRLRPQPARIRGLRPASEEKGNPYQGTMYRADFTL